MPKELTPRSDRLSGREIRKFGSTLARVRGQALISLDDDSSARETYEREPEIISSPASIVAPKYLERTIDNTIYQLESTAGRQDCEDTTYSYCVISPDGGACVFFR